MAAYLAAVEQGTYMHCLYNSDVRHNTPSHKLLVHPRGVALDGVCHSADLQ